MTLLMRRASILLFSLCFVSLFLLAQCAAPAAAKSLASTTGMVRFVHAAVGIAPMTTGATTTGATPTPGTTTTPQGMTGTQAATTPAVPIALAGAPGPVDIFLDGQAQALATQIAFGGTSGYLNLPAGNHQIQVAPAGKGVAAAATAQPLMVTAGTSQTAALIGGTAAIPFTLKAFVDNNTAPTTTTANAATTGMAQLRVYHLAPAQGMVLNMNVNTVPVVIGLQSLMASRYHTVAAGQSTFQVVAQANGQAIPVTTMTQTGQMQQLSMTLQPNTVNSIFLVDVPTAIMTNGTGTTTTAGLLAGTATVTATPAMPMTGSDPAASRDASWLITMGLVLLLGGGYLFFQLGGSIKRKTQAK